MILSTFLTFFSFLALLRSFVKAQCVFNSTHCTCRIAPSPGLCCRYAFGTTASGTCIVDNCQVDSRVCDCSGSELCTIATCDAWKPASPNDALLLGEAVNCLYSVSGATCVNLLSPSPSSAPVPKPGPATTVSSSSTPVTSSSGPSPISSSAISQSSSSPIPSNSASATTSPSSNTSQTPSSSSSPNSSTSQNPSPSSIPSPIASPTTVPSSSPSASSAPSIVASLSPSPPSAQTSPSSVPATPNQSPSTDLTCPNDNPILNLHDLFPTGWAFPVSNFTFSSPYSSGQTLFARPLEVSNCKSNQIQALDDYINIGINPTIPDNPSFPGYCVLQGPDRNTLTFDSHVAIIFQSDAFTFQPTAFKIWDIDNLEVRDPNNGLAVINGIHASESVAVFGARAGNIILPSTSLDAGTTLEQLDYTISGDSMVAMGLPFATLVAPGAQQQAENSVNDCDHNNDRSTCAVTFSFSERIDTMVVVYGFGEMFWAGDTDAKIFMQHPTLQCPP